MPTEPNESDNGSEFLPPDPAPFDVEKLELSSPTSGEKEVTILFAQLYEFDRLTEQAKAETRVELLNQYFEAMVEVIFEYQGTLDKYIDLTIMATFNSPLPLEDHALMAVKAALTMRDRLPEINRHWFPNEPHPLRMGIGINTDRVFSGRVGASQWSESTTVGHGVNVANHLSQQGQQYGCDILIGQKTYETCAESIQVKARELTYLTPQGKPFPVYELIGLKP